MNLQELKIASESIYHQYTVDMNTLQQYPDRHNDNTFMTRYQKCRDLVSKLNEEIFKKSIELVEEYFNR